MDGKTVHAMLQEVSEVPTCKKCERRSCYRKGANGGGGSGGAPTGARGGGCPNGVIGANGGAWPSGAYACGDDCSGGVGVDVVDAGDFPDGVTQDPGI
mmetsp:Transcript_90323/g.141578  ORF Transcript_90323/g.141578 Transcript_90323/m.141578 type:complete len:98 (+) Transcript_90323:37-330(+)